MWATKVDSNTDLNSPQATSIFHRGISDGSVLHSHKISQLQASMAPLTPLHDLGSSTFEGGTVTTSFAHINLKNQPSLRMSVVTEDDAVSVTPPETEPSSPKGGAKLSVFLGSRCTRVHFVRHAEGFHNVVTRQAGHRAEAVIKAAHEEAKRKALADGKSPQEAEALAKAAAVKVERVEENRPVHHATPGAEDYTDAELTEAGRNQCYALRGKMDRNLIIDPHHRTHIDLVVVSPLRRCLETADIIFGPGCSSTRPDLKPFLVNDLCRERYGEFYCDKRRAMSENKKDPRFGEWDWETQAEDWPSKCMLFSDEDTTWKPERETDEHVHERAMLFLQWLAKRPEREVAVVTHSSFLKNLFKVFGGETSEADQDVLRALPANCELRTVVLCHHG
mmetsp:Transcript_63979/g.208705  ORF Transcript_63979/g.208705 Transcript_63979/m.208705 type:complete len:392 (-) Transcript_63979:431-1606(-)